MEKYKISKDICSGTCLQLTRLLTFCQRLSDCPPPFCGSGASPSQRPRGGSRHLHVTRCGKCDWINRGSFYSLETYLTFFSQPEIVSLRLISKACCMNVHLDECASWWTLRFPILSNSVKSCSFACPSLFKWPEYTCICSLLDLWLWKLSVSFSICLNIQYC